MHIQHLEGLIATMQSAPAQPAPPPASEVEIPEEDYTTYGPDCVESTRRWARAEVQQDLARQQRQIDELRNRDAQFSGDRTKDKVRAELNRDPEIGPYWEQMDGDPAFNAWLADFDPFSGRPRLEMLHGLCQRRRGAHRQIFQAFLHEHTDLSRAPAARRLTPYPVTRPPQSGGGPTETAQAGGFVGVRCSGPRFQRTASTALRSAHLDKPRHQAFTRPVKRALQAGRRKPTGSGVPRGGPEDGRDDPGFTASSGHHRLPRVPHLSGLLQPFFGRCCRQCSFRAPVGQADRKILRGDRPRSHFQHRLRGRNPQHGR
jgi:hypothetical protein